MTCPVCGAKNGPTDQFCLRCGTRLQAAAAPPASQFLVPGAAGSTAHRLMAPLAIGGAAALLVFALFALFWVTTASQPAATRPTAAEITAAVQANNDAQVTALRTLDPQALDGKMTGPALDTNRAMIENLRSLNQYQEARLLHIDYSAPEFPAPNRATIQTVEQWASTVRTVGSGQVVRQDPPQTLHETYSLVRQNGHWLVEQVDIQEDAVTPGPVQ